MGNIPTPSLINLWFRTDIVDTKYETVHQIPLINLNKQQEYIPVGGETDTIAIVHYSDSKTAAEVCEKLGKVEGVKVYAVPDQNSKEDFQAIRNHYQRSFGKMVMNGSTSHPLFKFLKKNCMEFYDFQSNSAKKRISSQLGAFLIQSSNNAKKTKITYYNTQKLTQYLQKSQ